MDSIEKQADQNQAAFLDSALGVLILTGVAYLASFFFDCGYLGYFGLPGELADVSLRGLPVFIGVALSIIGVVAIVDPLATFLPVVIPAEVQTRLIALVWVSIIAAAFPFLEGYDWKAWCFYMSIPGVFILSEFLLPLYQHREINSFISRIEKAAARNAYADRTLVGRIRKSGAVTSRGRVFIIALMVSVVGLANPVGTYRARTQDTFAMHGVDERCAVLRVRTEGLLCAYIDKRKHVATGAFEFVSPLGYKMQSVEDGRIGPFVFEQHAAAMVAVPADIKSGIPVPLPGNQTSPAAVPPTSNEPEK